MPQWSRVASREVGEIHRFEQTAHLIDVSVASAHCHGDMLRTFATGIGSSISRVSGLRASFCVARRRD